MHRRGAYKAPAHTDKLYPSVKAAPSGITLGAAKGYRLVRPPPMGNARIP